jgi:hypothetical protein
MVSVECHGIANPGFQRQHRRAMLPPSLLARADEVIE